MRDKKAITVFGKIAGGKANNYRIPAIIKTRRGTLVAAADARFYSCNDNPNRIDKVVRRSEDGGKTWGEEIYAVKEQGNSRFRASAAIDACLLYDEKRDVIHMLYTHTPAGVGIRNAVEGKGIDKDGNRIIVSDNGEKYLLIGKSLFKDGEKTDKSIDDDGNVFQNDEKLGNIYTGDGAFHEQRTFFLFITESTDDGLTWGKPRLLNASIKDEDMNFIGAGPGNAIQLKHGKYSGRLIFPIYFNRVGKSLRESAAVIYSDDGVNWKRGKSINDTRNILRIKQKPLLDRNRVSESAVIELPDGTIRAFYRNHHPKREVAIAESRDGGETFENYRFIGLPQCVCQMSAVNVQCNGKVATLFINSASKRKRENGILRLSFDYGKSFPYSVTIKKDGFVYSSLTEIADGEVGVLYETSIQHETIDFLAYKISDIIDGEKRLTEEEV